MTEKSLNEREMSLGFFVQRQFMLEPLITDSLLLPGGIANKARRQKK